MAKRRACVTRAVLPRYSEARGWHGGARTFTALRVTVRAGILSNTATVTLYKTPSGGSPTITTMQVSIPAGSAAGTQIADTIHSQTFVAGDSYDVRMDDAADLSAATLLVSASLEYAP
jgi:16S rRNA C1402 N4-methylase RsmH